MEVRVRHQSCFRDIPWRCGQGQCQLDAWPGPEPCPVHLPGLPQLGSSARSPNFLRTWRWGWPRPSALAEGGSPEVCWPAPRRPCPLFPNVQGATAPGLSQTPHSSPGRAWQEVRRASACAPHCCTGNRARSPSTKSECQAPRGLGPYVGRRVQEREPGLCHPPPHPLSTHREEAPLGAQWLPVGQAVQFQPHPMWIPHTPVCLSDKPI